MKPEQSMGIRMNMYGAKGEWTRSEGEPALGGRMRTGSCGGGGLLVRLDSSIVYHKMNARYAA